MMRDHSLEHDGGTSWEEATAFDVIREDEECLPAVECVFVFGASWW